MEKFRIEHDADQKPTLAELNFPSIIAKNNYRLQIQFAKNNDYVLIAEPLGKQARKDSQCQQLMLLANNQRAISGSGKVEECW